MLCGCVCVYLVATSCVRVCVCRIVRVSFLWFFLGFMLCCFCFFLLRCAVPPPRRSRSAKPAAPPKPFIPASPPKLVTIVFSFFLFFFVSSISSVLLCSALFCSVVTVSFSLSGCCVVYREPRCPSSPSMSRTPTLSRPNWSDSDGNRSRYTACELGVLMVAASVRSFVSYVTKSHFVVL